MRKRDRERALARMSRQFMEPAIEYGEWWEVETTAGTWFVPYDCVAVSNPGVSLEGFRDYVEGEPQSAARITGYGARLSAPGYMDATEWTVFKTRKAAEEYLIETYDN